MTEPVTIAEASAVLALAPDDLAALISAGPFVPQDGVLSVRQLLSLRVLLDLASLPVPEAVAVALMVGAEAKQCAGRVLMVRFMENRITACWSDTSHAPSGPIFAVFADRILDELVATVAAFRSSTRRLN